MIVRIAPTPSGYLHWGNFFNFALTWTFARRRGGRVGLRIDDVDAARLRPEYLADIFATLAWLGFDWDFGPRDPEDFLRNHSQATRRAEFFPRIASLRPYACDCSRKRILERASAGSPASRGDYDGHCRERGLAFVAGTTSLRVRLDGVADPVVWTREDRPAYHWVSVLEDLRLGTTHLVRGEDLRESSRIQTLLAERLGESRYLGIEHRFHPLLLDEAGEKLSKSADAESIHALRAGGGSAVDAWRELARRIAVPDTVDSLAAFAALAGGPTSGKLPDWFRV